MSIRKIKSPILIAIDYNNINKALKFIDSIDPSTCRLKIGKEMFTLFGPSLVRRLQSRGFEIFLDLKYHDIPNTTARAVSAAAELGVWMVNVHASGGYNMLTSARKALLSYGKDAPLLVAVTMLTSLSYSDLSSIGVYDSESKYVTKLALLTNECGLDGVICSVKEIFNLKQIIKTNFIFVTPGIRLINDKKHDQQRIATPYQAQNAGANYIVIGRSITESINPANTIQNILKNLSLINKTNLEDINLNN